jgi:hypothetical protein
MSKFGDCGLKAVRQQDTKVALITYLLGLIEPIKLKIERLYLALLCQYGSVKARIAVK